MDKNGVKVYTKPDNESGIKSFKGVTQVNVSALDVLALLSDYDRYPLWIDRVTAAYILQEDSDSVYFIHVKVKLPFPVSNRDIVQRIEVVKRSDWEIDIGIFTVSDLIPEEKGFVRMPLSDGLWKLRQLNEGLTNVEMVLVNDPGGSVPKWMVNMLATDSPFKTLRNMKKILTE